MQIFLIYLLHVVTTCSRGEGTYILRVKIHLDELTLYKIVGMEMLENTFENKGPIEIAKNYLNKIFNDINEGLDRYGVQLEGDYTTLHLDELELKLDKEKICSQKQVAMVVNQLITPQLSYPNTDGLGLRIVGVSCEEFDPIQIPFFTLPNAGCGQIGTIFVMDPLTLKPQIELLMRGFITNGVGMFSPLSSVFFKKSLCRYSKKCTKNNDKFGVLKNKISRIRHNLYSEPPDESSHSELKMFNKR